MQIKRVVITGMGIYSCLGQTLEEVQDALFKGKSGIILDPERKALGFRSGLTGFVPLPDLKQELPRNQRIYMPEPAQYAYCATRDALKSAGLDQDWLDSHEVGLLYGNDSTADAVYKSISKIVEKKDTMLCGSGAIFQSMNSTVTMNLGVIFHLKGINLTVSGACASGSHAIGLGAMLIQNGLQDVVVCGGAQEVNPAATGSLRHFRLLCQGRRACKGQPSFRPRPRRTHPERWCRDSRARELRIGCQERRAYPRGSDRIWILLQRRAYLDS